jgi:DNA-directed RNA polymerase specialized sigma24 family protein
MVVTSFRALTTGPDPLSLDGTAIGHGLPRRVIRLDELRSILCHPATGRACRDAAWRHLVHAARARGPAWVVGAAGVGMPALRRLAAELSEGYRGDAADIASAVLAGFLEGLTRIDVDRPGVITRLRWMAYRAGIKARYTRDGVPVMPLPPLESQPPPAPWGHPDLILFDAVAKGVLSPLQAELIGRSRLENLTLKQAAAELGVGYEAARKARQRGEARLTAAMAAGDVEHRLSPSAANSGLHSAGEKNPEPGVRGRSIPSDGTSDDLIPDEKGVFCGPAHQLPPPNTPASSPARESAETPHGSEPRRDRIELPGRKGDTT